MSEIYNKTCVKSNREFDLTQTLTITVKNIILKIQIKPVKSGLSNKKKKYISSKSVRSTGDFPI